MKNDSENLNLKDQRTDSLSKVQCTNSVNVIEELRKNLLQTRLSVEQNMLHRNDKLTCKYLPPHSSDTLYIILKKKVLLS